MDSSENNPSLSVPTRPVSITIRSIGTRNLGSDCGHVVVILKHNLYAPIMFLLPFNAKEGSRTPEYWTNTWGTIVGWPGNQDLSKEQWALLSQTFHIFYYFAHRGQEALAVWPSFMRAYLLVGDLGTHFGEMGACGEIQLRLLVEWASARLPESLMPSLTLFQLPSDVDAVTKVDLDSGGNVDELSGWQFV